MHEERINSVLRPAFLAAVGDAHLDEAELNYLGEIRAHLRGFFDAEKAIVHYMNTGDFAVAKKMYNSDDFILVHTVNSFSLFGGLPPFLADLAEDRKVAKTEDEILAIYRMEAAKINNNFDREVSLLAMDWVASSDGEYSLGERITRSYFEDVWEMDEDRPNFERMACSVLKGEEILEKLTTDDLDKLKEILGFDDEEPAESIVFDSTGKKNNAPQVAACLTLMMIADGAINQEEVEELASSLSTLTKFYNYEDTEALSSDLSSAINGVIKEFAPYEEGVAPKGIKKYAKKMAKNITNKKLQALTCYFAIETAGADGLDPLEVEILQIFMDVWGVTEDDIDEAGDLI